LPGRLRRGPAFFLTCRQGRYVQPEIFWPREKTFDTGSAGLLQKQLAVEDDDRGSEDNENRKASDDWPNLRDGSFIAGYKEDPIRLHVKIAVAPVPSLEAKRNGKKPDLVLIQVTRWRVG